MAYRKENTGLFFKYEYISAKIKTRAILGINSPKMIGEGKWEQSAIVFRIHRVRHPSFTLYDIEDFELKTYHSNNTLLHSLLLCSV